jgi:hypothetical protein
MHFRIVGLAANKFTRLFELSDPVCFGWLLRGKSGEGVAGIASLHLCGTALST